MIGKLTGRIDSIYHDRVIIDVGGVGYSVYCSAKTLSKINVNESCCLFIETHVREDHIHLYGFSDCEEQSTFILLQSVKGVGTKMALSILSAISPDQIQIALSNRDVSVFHNISGIGKKLAERIITELKDKFIINIKVSGNFSGHLPTQDTDSTLASDAISALVNLGINRIEAQSRVMTILANNGSASINELIKLALKNGT